MIGRTSIYVFAATVSIRACQCASLSGPGGFELQCTSADDYGWPRFNSTEELQADAQWALYFRSVYGELPSLFPVCVYDLWYIDTEAYVHAGLNKTRPPIAGSPSEGDLYANQLSYMIYHGKYTPLANDTWVEVTHTVYPTELEGLWAWRTRGSGIWANVGNTLVFPTPANADLIHAEAIHFLREDCTCNISTSWPQLESDIFGCCAREKGIDSVQFLPQKGEVPLGTFGLAGLTELVLTNLDGDLACGVQEAGNTPLKSGWLATQPCHCKNQPIAARCGLMAFPPQGITARPPLCAWQATHPTQACEGTVCNMTKCNLPTSWESSLEILH